MLCTEPGGKDLTAVLSENLLPSKAPQFYAEEKSFLEPQVDPNAVQGIPYGRSPLVTGPQVQTRSGLTAHANLVLCLLPKNWEIC